MLPFKQIQYHDIHHNKAGILVGDIGGTNSNFGIAQTVNGELTLVSSVHIKSKEINNFSNVVKDILIFAQKTYNMSISNACFAVAGPVGPEQAWCKPTNLNITIDAQDILRIAPLKNVIIVNDFEVVGYGIEKIGPQDIITIQQGTHYMHGNKAILGAGTGLGKSILHWIESKNSYVSVASEGGHADFAAQTQQDLDLINYIKKNEPTLCTISWEHLLSGNGIGRIFNFMSAHTRNYNNTTVNAPPPDEIFKDKNLSPAHQKTAQLYAQLYARCAKNWALDTLALGGIYIAGGIAAHNVDLFKLPEFLTEFQKCDIHRDILSAIPLYIIADYNISLYGAIEYMRLKGRL